MTSLAVLPRRAVLSIEGEDRTPFLQGLVSNDVTEAAPGQAVWAALLTPQGKWLADFFIFADEDRLLLDCEREQVPALLQRLTRFRLRSKVTLHTADELSVYAAWGDKPDMAGIAAPDPRLPEAGWRLLSAAPLPTTALEADWDRHRLSLGLPDGSRDLESEKTVLLEAGFDELHGVSWSKGCYMGQELTARTKYRGLVKRRLVPVAVDGPLPLLGTTVLRDGTDVGTMRSGREQAGLAVVRLDALGGALTCGGAALAPQNPALDAGALRQVAPPLRIVNAMLGRGRGGLEQALLDYHGALRRFGHEMHTVIHPAAAIRPALEAAGPFWHGLTHLGSWDLAAAMRLRLLLRKLRPDICIAHGNRAMSQLRHAGAAPLVAVLPNYKMKCAGAAAVFHPTLDLKRYAQAQGVPNTRLHHIPSMVEVPPTLPRRWRHDTPVIGAMGRFVAKKGFDVFIAALGQLRERGILFQAVLAGDGPERPALERLANQHGLRGMLCFPGWLDDKPTFFGTIDVFCLPSRHEPFGIVLIEAMAQAVPIVATDSEGPSEILCNGNNGVLVRRDDSHGLAQALADMVSDPNWAAGLGTSAYRTAYEIYSVSSVGARLDLAMRGIVRARSDMSLRAGV